VNLLCTELHKNNYTVVTYSRKDNIPFQIGETGKSSRKRSVFPVRLLSYWLLSGMMADFAFVNEQGKTGETEKRAEVEFLLSRLPAFFDETGNGRLPPFLLAGYGAGGSALAYLAGESGFISRNANVIGVVAIASRLWSASLPLPRAIPQTLVNDNIVLRYWTLVGNYVNSVRPQRIVRNGALPGDGNSDGGFPVLYLISGKALNLPKGREPLIRKRYQAVFDTLRSGKGPVALAAIQEAGPLDYQDYPVTHPLYSFLVPGRKVAGHTQKDPIGDTAGIITNFVSFLLNRSNNGTVSNRHAISGSLYVESKGLPGFKL
jgi:hypothetical protein